MITISKKFLSLIMFEKLENLRRVGQHAYMTTGRTQVVAVSIEEYALPFAIYTMHE